MKLVSLFALLLLAGTAAATPRPVESAEGATSASVAASAPARMKCIRGKEIGSNRTKRVCLPEAQMKALTAEERADLLRGEQLPPPAAG